MTESLRKRLAVKHDYLRRRADLARLPMTAADIPRWKAPSVSPERLTRSRLAWKFGKALNQQARLFGVVYPGCPLLVRYSRMTIPLISSSSVGVTGLSNVISPCWSRLIRSHTSSTWT